MMLDVTTVDNNIFGQIDLIEFNFEYDSDKDKSGGAGKAKFSNLNIPPGNKEDYKFTKGIFHLFSPPLSSWKIVLLCKYLLTLEFGILQERPTLTPSSCPKFNRL